jgi:hypothetical protein
MDTFINAVMGPLKIFLVKAMAFLPHLLGMIVILVVGFVTAWITRGIASRFFSAVGFNTWSDKSGLTSMLQKAEVRRTPAQFLGRIIYWSIVIVFLMGGLSALDLEATNLFISKFFLYLPKFLSAVLIIVLGYLIASFLARATVLAGVNAGLAYSRLLGVAVRMLVLVFVFAMALEQLEIARGIVIAAFSILFGGILLALALAFGLGGRDVAKNMLEVKMESKEKEEKDEIKHI